MRPRDSAGIGTVQRVSARPCGSAAEDLDLDGAIGPQDLAQRRAAWSL
ncbi:MAG: hypothetical protein ACK5C3_03405 [bacterium]